MGGSALLLATLVLSGCGQDDASTSSNGTTSTSSEGPALESTVVSEDGSLGLAPVFEDVSQPMSTITRPGTESTYISTRDGFVLRVGPDGQQEVVLDLSDEVASTEGESGMYDIEFSPDGDWLYVSLCAKGGGSYNASYRVYAFAMVDGAPDESSRVDVLHVGDLGEAHNGGQIEFGPDGMLYLSLGDGGELSFTESQDLSDLRGKIVRLEVSGNPPDVLRTAR